MLSHVAVEMILLEAIRPEGLVAVAEEQPLQMSNLLMVLAVAFCQERFFSLVEGMN